MNDLDKLLQQLASRPVPPAPRNLEDAVWREVRRRNTPLRESVLDRLASYIWQRDVAAAAISAALAFGGVYGWLSAPEASAAQSAALALNLQIFSKDAPSSRLSSLYQ